MTCLTLDKIPNRKGVDALLEINHLSIGFTSDHGMVRAVNKVNFHVKEGQIIGLVGESGCGKSTVLFSIIGLIQHPGKMLEGSIMFNGRDLAKNSKEEWRKTRGKEIAMIFQDPMTTLNPAYRVGEQIREILKIHRTIEPNKKGWLSRMNVKEKEKERVLSIMREVGIPSPEKRYDDYPHQFSGGMQQRILIAMALACEPKLLLADEPTTALDVTIQAQILDVLKRINKTHGTSIILVTHDLGVASEFCDELAVMYAGQIVERGPTDVVIENPKHPYTQGLLRSIPRISEAKEKIVPISGNVVDLLNLGKECAFLSRCPHAFSGCRQEIGMVESESGHQVRCALYMEGSEHNVKPVLARIK